MMSVVALNFREVQGLVRLTSLNGQVAGQQGRLPRITLCHGSTATAGATKDSGRETGACYTNIYIYTY